MGGRKRKKRTNSTIRTSSTAGEDGDYIIAKPEEKANNPLSVEKRIIHRPSPKIPPTTLASETPHAISKIFGETEGLYNIENI